MSIEKLANGMEEDVVGRLEEALSLYAVYLDVSQRSLRAGAEVSTENLLAAKSNIAGTYSRLGRVEEAVNMEREIYDDSKALLGPLDLQTLSVAANLMHTMSMLHRFDEVKAFFLGLEAARQTLGPDNYLVLKLTSAYAHGLYYDPTATRDEQLEAITMFEDIRGRILRVWGRNRPHFENIDQNLAQVLTVKHCMRKTWPLACAIDRTSRHSLRASRSSWMIFPRMRPQQRRRRTRRRTRTNPILKYQLPP
jgi:hypothetical protein